jgi:hypothetical protein
MGNATAVSKDMESGMRSASLASSRNLVQKDPEVRHMTRSPTRRPRVIHNVTSHSRDSTTALTTQIIHLDLTHGHHDVLEIDTNRLDLHLSLPTLQVASGTLV